MSSNHNITEENIFSDKSNAVSRNKKPEVNIERASCNTLSPFPPFPTPMASKVSTPTTPSSKEYAHTIIDHRSANKKTRKSRSKRKWKSTGENNSSDSESEHNLLKSNHSDNVSNRDLEIEDEQNILYNKKSLRSKKRQSFQKRKWASGKTFESPKRGRSSRNQLRYKSNPQIIVYPTLEVNITQKDISTFDLDLTSTTHTCLPPGLKSASNSSTVETEEYQNGYLNVNQKTLRIDTARVNASKDMNVKEKEHAVQVEMSRESRPNSKDPVSYGMGHPLLRSSSSEEGGILYSQ